MKHMRYYLEDTGGGTFDICFCRNDCQNETCKRSTNGKHWERLQEYWKRYPYYRVSVSDFSEDCKEYKGAKK